MKVNINTSFELTEDTTLNDLREKSKQDYNNMYLLETLLAFKLGICDIAVKNQNHAYFIIYSNGEVSLNLQGDISIIKTLKNYKDIEVRYGDKSWYNPKNAGVFKEHFDKYFKKEKEKELDFEEILGDDDSKNGESVYIYTVNGSPHTFD